jgi:hypothetical protein
MIVKLKHTICNDSVLQQYFPQKKILSQLKELQVSSQFTEQLMYTLTSKSFCLTVYFWNFGIQYVGVDRMNVKHWQEKK